EENGELEADIAHHWQQISPLLWRFYLRPGIHFHHGRELEMEDAAATAEPVVNNKDARVNPSRFFFIFELHSQMTTFLSYVSVCRL
ncbi:hypothetical protein MJL48_31450, partial [Salmonella enterica subsp. enterica serovar Kentucky]|nr:hypothetical protein [Salmonella enterica subsp. enterica serovar Kentucky]